MRHASRGAFVALAAVATLGAAACSGATRTSSAEHAPAPATAEVVKGNLSASVSLDGALTRRARPDGSPYVVVNRARGTYTELPDDGAEIACGGVLYRVDDRPVLLLCGAVPAYRDLRAGASGNDVRQLNRNLHDLGYDPAIDPADDHFSNRTMSALSKLQRDTGVDATGALTLDAAVFLPGAVQVAKVTGQLGGVAEPGATVAQATSDTPEVQVSLDASQQGEVQQGDRARITLPGNRSVTGKVERIGAVAEVPPVPNGTVQAATVAAYLALDDPGAARALDRAPVRVEITTTGVADVLSVPVTALVGRTGGGFAVEVVRTAGRRALVAVRLGLFDTTSGRVQVEGGVHEGDHVVVPSS